MIRAKRNTAKKHLSNNTNDVDHCPPQKEAPCKRQYFRYTPRVKTDNHLKKLPISRRITRGGETSISLTSRKNINSFFMETKTMKIFYDDNEF